LPGLPPVVVDVTPGTTLEEAEAYAAVEAGLRLMHPPRRVFGDVYKDWVDPTFQLSPDRVLKA
jgi:hypothetical protein